MDIEPCFFPVLAIVIAHKLKNNQKYVWVFFLIGAIVAFLSKSRFILLNFAVLFAIIPFYRKVDLKTMVRFILTIIVSIALLLVVAKQLNLKVNEIVEKRLLESDQGGMTHGAAGTRILAFEIFGKLFSENAVFGKGKLHDFGNSKDYDLMRALQGRSSQIHVGFLSLLYYYGIVGGGLFLLFIGYSIYDMTSSAKIHHYWGPLFGFVQLVLTNMTSVILHVYLMGYILCFIFDRYYSNQMKLNQKQI